MIRLDRFLCEMNEGTRSEVKKLISKGLVEVNGEAVSDPGKKVDPDKDCIFVGGCHIAYAEFEYFMLNKPAGVISASRADLRSKDESCVVDLISDKKRKDLFPVGTISCLRKSMWISNILQNLTSRLRRRAERGLRKVWISAMISLRFPAGSASIQKIAYL